MLKGGEGEAEGKPLSKAGIVTDVICGGATATAIDDARGTFAPDALTNGAWFDGIVSQQFFPWLCGAHGIVLQHCIICVGVIIAEQSAA